MMMMMKIKPAHLFFTRGTAGLCAGGERVTMGNFFFVWSKRIRGGEWARGRQGFYVMGGDKQGN